MKGCVQVKADVSRDLKRRAFAILALRDEFFTDWLARQLEALVREGVDPNGQVSEACLVGVATDDGAEEQR